MLALLLALATSTAHAEPLQDPYRECSQQTLDTAIALERAGDREALRDHVRSFGCRLIWPREGFETIPPEPGRGGPRAGGGRDAAAGRDKP
jgi:hypothetical protein